MGVPAAMVVVLALVITGILLSRQPGRILEDPLGGDLNILGVSARDSQSREGETRCGSSGTNVILLGILWKPGSWDHSIARLEATDPLTQLGHFPGGIRTQDVGEGKLSRDGSFPELVIESVDAGGQHLDQDVSWPGPGCFQVSVLQDIDITKLSDHCCFHVSLSLI